MTHQYFLPFFKSDSKMSKPQNRVPSHTPGLAVQTDQKNQFLNTHQLYKKLLRNCNVENVKFSKRTLSFRVGRSHLKLHAEAVCVEFTASYNQRAITMLCPPIKELSCHPFLFCEYLLFVRFEATNSNRHLSTANEEVIRLKRKVSKTGSSIQWSKMSFQRKKAIIS